MIVHSSSGTQEDPEEHSNSFLDMGSSILGFLPSSFSVSTSPTGKKLFRYFLKQGNNSLLLKNRQDKQ